MALTVGDRRGPRDPCLRSRRIDEAPLDASEHSDAFSESKFSRRRRCRSPRLDAAARTLSLLPEGRGGHDPSVRSLEAEPSLSAEVRASAEGIIEALLLSPSLTETELLRLFRRFPRARGRLFRKSELIQIIRRLGPERGWPVQELSARLRRKPIRSQSGVLPVTVLTRPFPCPGRCVFCPNDLRMPKSYLSNEPGALRAAQFRFDPYAQVTVRLFALARNGHVVDKVELIVLGGTWTHYPESYRVGFIRRMFEALNDFDPDAELPDFELPPVDYEALPEVIRVDHAGVYNARIQAFWRRRSESPGDPEGSYESLERALELNQDARCRSVGLSIETRPDEIDADVVRELRKLGATKVQIGIQSLDDEVLRANQRGHDVARTREAIGWLRAAGFKVQGHWMANLLGSTPERDREDYLRLFDDPDIRPDELKLYPTSLIESAELMSFHERGAWRPYSDEELLSVVTFGLAHTPRTCRLSRVIRDIPSTDIVVGNKEPNFRERAERTLVEDGTPIRDIRAREIRGRRVGLEALELKATEYACAVGRDVFIEAVDGEDRLAGFCRLTLPDGRVPPPFEELEGAALIRELHVYGPAVALDGQEDFQEIGRAHV